MTQHPEFFKLRRVGGQEHISRVAPEDVPLPPSVLSEDDLVRFLHLILPANGTPVGFRLVAKAFGAERQMAAFFKSFYGKAPLRTFFKGHSQLFDVFKSDGEEFVSRCVPTLADERPLVARPQLPPPAQQQRAPPPAQQQRAPPPAQQQRAPQPAQQQRAPPPAQQQLQESDLIEHMLSLLPTDGTEVMLRAISGRFAQRPELLDFASSFYDTPNGALRVLVARHPEFFRYYSAGGREVVSRVAQPQAPATQLYQQQRQQQERQEPRPPPQQQLSEHDLIQFMLKLLPKDGSRALLHSVAGPFGERPELLAFAKVFYGIQSGALRTLLTRYPEFFHYEVSPDTEVEWVSRVTPVAASGESSDEGEQQRTQDREPRVRGARGRRGGAGRRGTQQQSSEKASDSSRRRTTRRR